ncbi:hypothetical protein [Undibacterium curvum]|uniref:hypothetical protein n=1 Tax=Undibacterium curvum TaxID=2762294 RepID=UPI003D098FED
MAMFLRLLTGLFLSAFLAACGGGGGSSGSNSFGSTDPGTGQTTKTGKMDVTLFDSNGSPTNVINNANGLIARARVYNNTGTPVAGVVVKFGVDDANVATLSPGTGSALTNENGVAEIAIKAGNPGATSITASATWTGFAAISAKATFSVGSLQDAIPFAVNFVSASPSTKSIVIKGAGGNGRTEIALLTFRVVDGNNGGIKNKKVNFTAKSSAPVNLATTSGVTDSNGNVVATVSSGTQPTSVLVSATVDGTSIATSSDTVSVTTGVPTQTSFSLGVEKINVEGFDSFGIKNKLTAYLADANGGVVADGVAVVFTTNSGAIIGDDGNADTARCLTKNGSCSVTWQSQNPQLPVVRVVATAVSGSENLSANTGFTNSASWNPTVEGWQPSVVFGSATCGDLNYKIYLSDRNGYQLPAGTVLSFIDSTNVTATISPTTITAFNTIDFKKTEHTVILKPTDKCPKGFGSTTLQIETPNKVKETKVISITYN